MDAQSPSKRFTRNKTLACRNIIEHPSFSLGLTRDFGKVAGKKDQSDIGSSKKRKEKITNYIDGNAKRKEVVVSGSLEHDEFYIVTMLISKVKCIK
ncbi:hypothetical protein H5410_023509 [Solanum commersonii]|uniref:Uncharacterized protein n=1 Tax=Solanum commersonii TaxID=4109 RepID=A0A9J5ZJN8_SOLCO|nr:hypothetical protein H5410_023509 [Solanum commersonii]